MYKPLAPTARAANLAACLARLDFDLALRLRFGPDLDLRRRREFALYCLLLLDRLLLGLLLVLLLERLLLVLLRLGRLTGLLLGRLTGLLLTADGRLLERLFLLDRLLFCR